MRLFHVVDEVLDYNWVVLAKNQKDAIKRVKDRYDDVSESPDDFSVHDCDSSNVVSVSARTRVESF